jgi:hypothetical protein
MVVSRSVCELEPRVGHIEQHDPVDLCGGLCQPYAIFGKLAVVGLGFHGPTFLSPCETAIPIQPARSVRETVKASLCRIEHCGKTVHCEIQSALRNSKRLAMPDSATGAKTGQHFFRSAVGVNFEHGRKRFFNRYGDSSHWRL